ncbi:NADP-dependent oxidoreductase domain-containing protein, partial [Leptodontidium sp. MPI-SDFR-AT-0119]
VSISVLDRRVTRQRISDVCVKHGVGILAYGVLLGGFLSEKWLGAVEPDPSKLGEGNGEMNWSLRKYLRFINAAGGWAVFQNLLRALNTVAERHGVRIPAVAMRFALNVPGVSAVIVGTRLSADSGEYARRNMQVFGLRLTDEDRSVV